MNKKNTPNILSWIYAPNILDDGSANLPHTGNLH